MTHVAVVGAGPAGLAAAVAALAAGARVTLLDSADQVGGQYWRHLPAQRSTPRESALHHGWSIFQRLRATLEQDTRCTVETSTQVWAIEQSSGPVLQLLSGPPDGPGRRRWAMAPDAVVLATGAHDRTLPFPGWQLPGVFTGGAAQALAKSERVAVGRRVVVAGAGPFLLPVASALVRTGARVVGVFESSGAGTVSRGWLRSPWQLAGVSGKAAELAGYLALLARHRIPYRPGWAVVAAHGQEQVDAVTVARLNSDWSTIDGTERRIAADAVCVSHGFTPRLELAIAAGCALTADRFVEVDDRGATSQVSVFAAGELTGIGGADAALAEGQVAGHCAAGGASSDAAVAGAVRTRAAMRRFAVRLERAHGIGPAWPGWLDEDTVVCRCEEVSHGELCRVAAATAATGLRSVKLTSRAGLGICQGRICGRTVEELLRARDPAGFLDTVSSDRRPIAFPIRLEELARPPEASAETDNS